MNAPQTWQEVVIQCCQLGGSVVVACVALWLYVPAMNRQHEALMKSQAEDRAQFERQTDKLWNELLAIRNLLENPK